MGKLGDNGIASEIGKGGSGGTAIGGNDAGEKLIEFDLPRDFRIGAGAGAGAAFFPCPFLRAASGTSSSESESEAGGRAAGGGGEAERLRFVP